MRITPNTGLSIRWHRKCLNVGIVPPEQYCHCTALHSEAPTQSDMPENLRTESLDSLQQVFCVLVPP